MIVKLRLKHLLAAALFGGFSNLAAANAEENRTLAPEATAAEAELSFRDIPVLENAFINTVPTDRQDGISVGELGVDGGNKDMLVALAQEIADGQYGNHDSLLIAHKGELVFESYFRKGRINLPHPQASATKTYTSLALGRAIQLGYLTMADLDEPLVSFLGDLDPTRLVEGAELITLHHALTMTTGIRLTEEQQAGFEEAPSQIQGQRLVQAMLEQSTPITSEAQSFLYGTGPGLVMQVIEAVVPGSAEGFIEDELLDKIGITNYNWRTHVSGLPQAGSRASMTSRDMIKWGTLLADKGKWNGEQLIPQAFIYRATSMVIDVGDDDIYGGGADVSNQGYGYFMWNADLRHSDQSYYSASAQGGGGQFIILVEELDLMVVSTASEREPSTLQMTAERILPTFIE